MLDFCGSFTCWLYTRMFVEGASRWTAVLYEIQRTMALVAATRKATLVEDARRASVCGAYLGDAFPILPAGLSRDQELLWKLRS